MGSRVKRPPVEPESSVLARVLEALKACGNVHVMRNNVGAGRVRGRFQSWGLGAGSADIVAVVGPHGRWLCVECKRSDGGVMEVTQGPWLARMRELGAVCGVATTPDEALDLVARARRSP